MKDFLPVLKILLIGGGLYWGYRQFMAPAAPAGNGGGAAPPPTPANGGGPPVVETPPAAPRVSLPTPPALRTYTDQEKRALVVRAAAGELGAAAIVQQLGIQYNSDEWNFYRAEGGGGQTTADLFPIGNRGYRMTIEEYLNARRQVGLSGLAHVVQHIRAYKGAYR